MLTTPGMALLSTIYSHSQTAIKVAADNGPTPTLSRDQHKEDYMSIKFKSAPDDVRREAISGMQRTHKGSPLLGAGLPVDLTTPHEVFTLSPDAVRAGHALNDAESTGWRYLAGVARGQASGGAAPASSVVEVATTGGGSKFSHRQMGWMGAETQKAIGVAEQLPEVGSGDYDLRMLRLPGIARTDAIWLKDNRGAEDLVVPIASASSHIEAGVAYPVNQFMDLIRAEASKNLINNAPRIEKDEERGG
jgi:hypothetical protein